MLASQLVSFQLSDVGQGLGLNIYRLLMLAPFSLLSEATLKSTWPPTSGVQRKEFVCLGQGVQ